MQLDFLGPARLDDLLTVTVEIRTCKRASVLFAQTILRDGQLLLTAEVRVAVLSAASFRPKPAPDALYEEFKALEVPKPLPNPQSEI